MSSQYWRNYRGTVLVRDAQCRVKVYDSLVQACQFLGDRCLQLSKGHLGSWMSPWRESHGYYWGGDSHVLYDELGLLIPVWKIHETYLNLPLQEVQSWRFYQRYPNYNRDRDFRNGSVPGIRHSHWSWNGGSPRLRTRQEIRENDFIAYDEDCLEHEIRVRAARRRPAVPSKWDDKPRARRGRGWKQQDRHTQWRS